MWLADVQLRLVGGSVTVLEACLSNSSSRSGEEEKLPFRQIVRLFPGNKGHISAPGLIKKKSD